jgi:RNA polymerase sigma factor (sigma-70 family)
LSTAVDTSRPSRAEIEPAALDLIQTHGAQIMGTARRYAATPEDAEDTYQRGLEILLTKAPTTSADDLVPWLKTVVKHEAFALRKQRERHGVPAEYDDSRPAHGDTHEHVERLDQLQRGAEAMQRLKPQEIRCLLLLAEGHTYAEICNITGFTYTKVNRCLAEGRKSFMQRVDGIESGAECARLAPLVSAAADGEASADDMLAVRRHMRGCLACRASLREARSVPARVAALAPAGIVFVPHGGGAAPPLHCAWSWLHERFAAAALRGQDVMEMAAAHKTVAVMASAAALAGGGAATVHSMAGGHHPHAARSAAAVVAPAKPERHPAPAPAATPKPASAQPVKAARRGRHRVLRADRRTPAPTPTPAPQATTPEPSPAPAPTHTYAPKAPPPPQDNAAPPSGTDGEFGP